VRLFRTTGGVFVEEEEQHYLIAEHGWDSLLSRDDLPDLLPCAFGSRHVYAGQLIRYRLQQRRAVFDGRVRIQTVIEQPVPR